MTITIDGKNYDENKLDKKVVNSIGQIAILQKRMNDIQMDHENAKVLLAHHQKNVKDIREGFTTSYQSNDGWC